MDSLEKVRELVGSGHFGIALKTLDECVVVSNGKNVTDTLRAELLEHIGNHGQSRALAERLLKTRDLSASNRSASELVLARIDWESGATESAIVHMQRAISVARQAKELERTCWAQLRLLMALADRSGPDAARPLLAELRANTIKLGLPLVSAALHVVVAELEAKRGLFQSAGRHLRLADALFAKAPNSWWQSKAANVRLAVSLLQSDFDSALQQGQHALHYADESQRADGRRSSLGNLGNLSYLTGKFDEAIGYFERAIAALPSIGEFSNGAIDALAKVCIAQGDITEASRLLDRIDESIRVPRDRLLYAHRHALLTRAELLNREKKPNEALVIVDSALSASEQASDHLLQVLAIVLRAELLQQIGNVSESIDLLTGLAPTLVIWPPDLHVRYEGVFALSLAAHNDVEAAQAHFYRAKRISDGLHNVPLRMNLVSSWSNAASEKPLPKASGASSPRAEIIRRQHVFQSVAAIMLHAKRPEVVALELAHLLRELECAESPLAVSRNQDGSYQSLSKPKTRIVPNVTATDRIVVGTTRDKTVEVVFQRKSDLESIATVNAVRIVLDTIHDLERARAEREDRLTLWPIEDVPSPDGLAVVGGQMRDVLALARRVATTNVSVLITGESGTGKEIVARAVHAFSGRAQKPFLAFNCTAVPREMLESQVFGHRRGAFTGAERDYAGLIRSARDGTVFLDEIGELGFDLQPKLLRFLESGEIAPLGEPPTIVDVRIIAATNADLDQLVRDGRFREDLFYRLNVVRLRVPPLRERRDEIPALVNHFVRRGAEEFKKGQVRVAEETMECLLTYRWPGNVRQLQNELRRMIAIAERDAVLSPRDLSDEIRGARPAPEARGSRSEIAVSIHDKLGPTLSRIEREMIKAALREHRGKVDAAARALGISRKGLYLKRQRLGL